MQRESCVSVIIPTHNRAHCVAEAIDSVLAQYPPANEIIVIDDGSTDNTTDVLDTYSDRITVLHQANAGAAAARNLGLAHARGKWIAFLDSDDVWLDGRLALLHQDLNRDTNKGMVLHVADLRMTGEGYCQSLFELRGWKDPGEELISDYFSRAMSGISPCSSAVRYDAAQKVGGFPADFPIGEDIYFFSAVSLVGPAMFSSRIVAEARRLVRDEVAAVDLFRDDPVKAYTVSHERFKRLAELPMDDHHRTLLQRHKSGNLFNLARSEAEAGFGGHRARLFQMIKEHPNRLKALLKATLPLLIGRVGYRFVGGKKSRFSRVRKLN